MEKALSAVNLLGCFNGVVGNEHYEGSKATAIKRFVLGGQADTAGQAVRVLVMDDDRGEVDDIQDGFGSLCDVHQVACNARFGGMTEDDCDVAREWCKQVRVDVSRHAHFSMGIRPGGCMS